MTIQELEDNDPVFYDYLVDEILDQKDLTIKELSINFDLPINIIKQILKRG
tara:strand:+ start:905 stop:1057 length:153 start_codon:yes stop_codon:yes gene_type:complete